MPERIAAQLTTIPVFLPVEPDNSLEVDGEATVWDDGTIEIQMRNQENVRRIQALMAEPRLLGVGFFYIPKKWVSDGGTSTPSPG